jgi:hypothetical protein
MCLAEALKLLTDLLYFSGFTEVSDDDFDGAVGEFLFEKADSFIDFFLVSANENYLHIETQQLIDKCPSNSFSESSNGHPTIAIFLFKHLG